MVFLVVLAPVVAFCLVILSPPALEMVEGGLLLFTAVVESDTLCGDTISSTVVLVVLDFVIAAPVMFAGLGMALSVLWLALSSLHFTCFPKQGM